MKVHKNTALRLRGTMNSGVCKAQASLIYCMQLNIVDIFKQKRCYDAQTDMRIKPCKSSLALGWLVSKCLSHTSE